MKLYSGGAIDTIVPLGDDFTTILSEVQAKAGDASNVLKFVQQGAQMALAVKQGVEAQQQAQSWWAKHKTHVMYGGIALVAGVGLVVFKPWKWLGR